MTRLFPHLGGYYDVPDEEKKNFICHRCTDLTTINNAKNIDSKLMLPFKTLANTIWGSGGSNSA